MNEIANTTRNIFTVLDLNATHLPEDDFDELNSIEGVTAYETSFGWLLYVPKDIATTLDELLEDGMDDTPEALMGIWRRAAKLGCTYVMLDREGSFDSELPSYEW